MLGKGVYLDTAFASEPHIFVSPVFSVRTVPLQFSVCCEPSVEFSLIRFYSFFRGIDMQHLAG